MPDHAIEGVSTTTAAIVGFTERGPLAPRAVTSWMDYVQWFGGYVEGPDPYTPHAVKGFFENGGRRIVVARVTGDAADTTAYRAGLAALEPIEGISLLIAPAQRGGDALAAELVKQSEARKDRFAILNGPPATLDSSYAAIYYPWLRTGGMLIPPCGHVAGIVARVDIERGVHKAPANEVVRGIDGLAELAVANPLGVNLIRDFGGRGIRVWGARTMSADNEWKYVNVRRLFIFLERSISRGTQWVVSEPNIEPTWRTLRMSIEAFLRQVWRNGALMGARPRDAFFVKCDRTTMTQDDIDSGRLICLIGIAPVKPAEFVIFRISHHLRV